MKILPLLRLSFALSVSLFPYTNASVGWHGEGGNREKRQTKNQTRDGSNDETIKVISTDKDASNVDENNYKKTYQELKTYALLQNDWRGSLQTNFTICSTIFTTKDYIHFPLILLGKDNNVLVETYIWNSDNKGLVNTSRVGLNIQDVEFHDDATVFQKAFPDQWIKSCLAFSVESGSIKWVLDGILVHNIISD